MRQPREYEEIHREADRFEPRLERAFVKAQDALREKVDLDALANAIADGNVGRAMAAIPDDAIERSMEPTVAILTDAHLRGSRVGANLLNAAADGGRLPK